MKDVSAIRDFLRELGVNGAHVTEVCSMVQIRIPEDKENVIPNPVRKAAVVVNYRTDNLEKLCIRDDEDIICGDMDERHVAIDFADIQKFIKLSKRYLAEMKK